MLLFCTLNAMTSDFTDVSIAITQRFNTVFFLKTTTMARDSTKQTTLTEAHGTVEDD